MNGSDTHSLMHVVKCLRTLLLKVFLKAICRIGSAHIISVSESHITLKSCGEVFTNTFIKKFIISYLQDVFSITLVNGCDTHPVT